jgi:hypothetical protein
MLKRMGEITEPKPSAKIQQKPQNTGLDSWWAVELQQQYRINHKKSQKITRYHQRDKKYCENPNKSSGLLVHFPSGDVCLSGSSISFYTSNFLLIGMVFLYELILPNCNFFSSQIYW